MTAPTTHQPPPEIGGPGPKSILTDDDIYLFNEGTHYALGDKLGAHAARMDGREGVFFAVWAPNARALSVIGDFNGWNRDSHPMVPRGSSGIWELFVPDIGRGAHYKFFVRSNNGYEAEKADPYGRFAELPPRTASIVWDLDYEWNDGEWMATRWKNNALNAPISIYEAHLGSWRHRPDAACESFGYRDLAHELGAYVKEMGFTHVEFMPVMEHPFYGSWGYQTTGYFAPTSRFGTPQDFMYLVDHLHQLGIGVILDWAPSHFPDDEYALAHFDGTCLYEHMDPRQGFHPDWKSLIFNYGRDEVRCFLISSALFWLDKYHIDGLRVDAVASMLYLDYSREAGEWIPNKFGGRENLDAIEFIRRLNVEVYRRHPDTQTYAEESTAWPMVSRPIYLGGLGFGMKWDMGWMHDTLVYMSKDPIHRKHHHNQLTFRQIYALHENFVMPLSHDEVVHGKGSLIAKMPGDDWQKFANMRLLFALMYGQNGKKLIFMGGEIGQWAEWKVDGQVEWGALDHEPHRGLQRCVADLNRVYRENPAMHEGDFAPGGFEWIDAGDWERSIVSWVRLNPSGEDVMLMVYNATPEPRLDYRVGVPRIGYWKEVFNSDAGDYGGSGHGNYGGQETLPIPWAGRQHSLTLTLPPLSATFFKYVRNRE